MTAIFAILNDSLRELRAKRLFWFVLALSGLVVISFGSIGFDDKGVSILYGLKHFEEDLLAAGSPFAEALMEVIFSQFVVGLWLSWGAIILALISTAGIFPDFISSGSIDLVLSKPPRRITVFLTKYVGSLLFVVMQVLIVCVGVFFIFGWRLGDWQWRIFMAVPLITAVFSYLYGLMVLLNILTRSTLASLVLVAIFWLSTFGVNLAQGILLAATLQLEAGVEVETDRIDAAKIALETAESKSNEVAIDYAQGMIDESEDQLEKYNDLLGNLKPWADYLVTPLANVLPKTSETIDIMVWSLDADNELSMFDLMQGRIDPNDPNAGGAPESGMHFVNDPEARALGDERFVQYYKDRTATYILTTSLAFEAVLLVFAGFLFVRRDY